MTKREMAAMVREYELRLAPAGYTMLLGEIIASYGDPCLLISSPEGDEPISDAEYDEIREAYEDLSAAQRAYTYSIYDDDPQAGSASAWDDHDDAEIEAIDAIAASDGVREIMETEAAGLSASDGYRPGQVLYALIWDAAGAVVGTPTYTLRDEDLA